MASASVKEHALLEAFSIMAKFTKHNLTPDFLTFTQNIIENTSYKTNITPIIAIDTTALAIRMAWKGD